MRSFDLKIHNREQALKITRDSGLAFLGLAIIQALVAVLLMPIGLVDAALYAILAIALLLLKSRLVAICLLMLSLVTLTTTFLNRLGYMEAGGRNLTLAFFVVYTGARAVQATFALHRPALREPALAAYRAQPDVIAVPKPPTSAVTPLERWLLIAIALLFGLIAIFAILVVVG